MLKSSLPLYRVSVNNEKTVLIVVHTISLKKDLIIFQI